MEAVFEFLKKIQSKPETEKRRILWISVCASALFLGFLWIRNMQSIIKGVDEEPTEQDMKAEISSSPIDNLISGISGIKDSMIEKLEILSGGSKVYVKSSKED